VLHGTLLSFVDGFTTIAGRGEASSLSPKGAA
jgi:hypothetical protein